MHIGQAADASGVSAERICYYEQIDRIDAAKRSAAAYRVYNERDLHALRFIHRARQLGFSISKIDTLLALWRDRQRSSADVKNVAMTHVEELRRKIAEHQSMVDTLENLAARCDDGSRPECPALAELWGVEP